jgi:hypothetical protein
MNKFLIFAPLLLAHILGCGGNGITDHENQKYNQDSNINKIEDKKEDKQEDDQDFLNIKLFRDNCIDCTIYDHDKLSFKYNSFKSASDDEKRIVLDKNNLSKLSTVKNLSLSNIAHSITLNWLIELNNKLVIVDSKEKATVKEIPAADLAKLILANKVVDGLNLNGYKLADRQKLIKEFTDKYIVSNEPFTISKDDEKRAHENIHIKKSLFLINEQISDINKQIEDLNDSITPISELKESTLLALREYDNILYEKYANNKDRDKKFNIPRFCWLEKCKKYKKLAIESNNKTLKLEQYEPKLNILKAALNNNISIKKDLENKKHSLDQENMKIINSHKEYQAKNSTETLDKGISIFKNLCWKIINFYMKDDYQEVKNLIKKDKYIENGKKARAFYMSRMFSYDDLDEKDTYYKLLTDLVVKKHQDNMNMAYTFEFRCKDTTCIYLASPKMGNNGYENAPFHYGEIDLKKEHGVKEEKANKYYNDNKLNDNFSDVDKKDPKYMILAEMVEEKHDLQQNFGFSFKCNQSICRYLASPKKNISYYYAADFYNGEFKKNDVISRLEKEKINIIFDTKNNYKSIIKSTAETYWNKVEESYVDTSDYRLSKLINELISKYYKNKYFKNKYALNKDNYKFLLKCNISNDCHYLASPVKENITGYKAAKFYYGKVSFSESK